MGVLDIEDIGNCAIEACNDEGFAYYLIIDCKLGSCRIMEYGPVLLDVDELQKSVICKFDRIEYNQQQIQKRINEFLNTPMRKITQAMEVSKEVALENCIPILDYMRGDNY